MYLPQHFEETRAEILHGLMREHPLGALVTAGPGGLNANHLPFLVDPEPAPFGTLRGHVARANPAWRDFSRDLDALVIFQGPRAYVSPSWYATKMATGKVVPTFNYMVVHAYGRVRAIEDPAWLRDLVERLTRRFEGGMPEPWAVDDAPAEYVESQLRAIVGIEIPVARLLGKWKLSQNRPGADREGTANALDALDNENARAIAEQMRKA